MGRRTILVTDEAEVDTINQWWAQADQDGERKESDHGDYGSGDANGVGHESE